MTPGSRPLRAGEIDNPYAAVDWDTVEYLRSVSHQHSGHTEKEIIRGTYDLFGNGWVERLPLTPDRPSLFVRTHSNPVRVRVEFNPAQVTIREVVMKQMGWRPWQDAFRSALDGTLLEEGLGRVEGLQYPDGGGITLNHPNRDLAFYLEKLDFDRRVLGIAQLHNWLDDSQIPIPVVDMIFSQPIRSQSGEYWWSDAVNLGGRWKSLNWLGYFVVDSTDWVYHNEHGWMYGVGEQASSVWFWTRDMGWLWTSSSTYPALYSANKNGWIWYLKPSRNPRWFMDMNTGLWESR